jgi:cystathionine beta-lyase/cystathionine gamma-synthase
MVSFKVTSAELAKNVLARLKLIAFAESLLTYPLAQTHAEMPQELLARTGLDDKLLRLSVGIEAVADLIADLQQALEG